MRPVVVNQFVDRYLKEGSLVKAVKLSWHVKNDVDLCDANIRLTVTFDENTVIVTSLVIQGRCRQVVRPKFRGRLHGNLIQPKNYRYNPTNYPTGLETKMTKLTLQEQMLKAGLVTSKNG